MRFILSAFLFLPAAFGQNSSLFGFQPNSGQFPPAVRFVRYATGSNFFYLTQDSFVLQDGVRIQIGGMNSQSEPIGDSPTATVYNFYRGNSPSQWITNAHMYAAVKIPDVYPGISAVFTTSTPESSSVILFPMGQLIFSIAPGADPGIIRVKVLNTGAIPFEGPDGIWFAGGRIPGVITISAEATQLNGASRVSLSSHLNIESPDTLSIQLTDRNPALPTEVAISFPDFDLGPQQPTPTGLTVARVQYPLDFGEDGAIANSNCERVCSDAMLARLDDQGYPIWVSVFGGSGYEDAGFATTSQDGVVLSGITGSDDFPVTPNAPKTAPGSAQDAFLALVDSDSGHLRNATYAGLPGRTALSATAGEFQRRCRNSGWLLFR